MNEEIWKPVVGYEGVYSVSDLGRVRRERRGHGTWIGRVLRAANSHGYGVVTLRDDGRDYKKLVHRLVAEAFFGPCPDGHNVNHKDGVCDNNSACNLEYTTWKGNVRHARDVLGKTLGPTNPARGVKAAQARLNDERVIEIRKALASGELQKEIAVRYGVSQVAISCIRRGKTWAHVI